MWLTVTLKASLLSQLLTIFHSLSALWIIYQYTCTIQQDEFICFCLVFSLYKDMNKQNSGTNKKTSANLPCWCNPATGCFSCKSHIPLIFCITSHINHAHIYWLKVAFVFCLMCVVLPRVSHWTLSRELYIKPNPLGPNTKKAHSPYCTPYICYGTSM